jgi:dihydrofolate synthase/folylpolyglutamate synthase
MLEAVLEAHGVATGLTTSPHLVRVEERIRIRGKSIDRTRLDRYLEILAPHDDLTFFETVTGAAFLAFADAGVEVAVLEAGMGGSWDATRVAASPIAGITNVGTDHISWLGPSPEDRARDKGGPLRSAELAVIGPGLAPGLVSALAAPHAVEARGLVELTTLDDGSVRISWNGRTRELAMPLPGAHQVTNLHLALALARCAETAGFVSGLAPGAVARGLADLRWPGRLSEVRVAGRGILVDGAHNPEGAVALASHLGGLPHRSNLLFSCLEDKDVDAMASALAPVVDEVAVFQLDDERAMPGERLATAFPGAHRAPDLNTALDRLPDPVVAAGSLRLVGALLEADEGGSRG